MAFWGTKEMKSMGIKQKMQEKVRKQSEDLIGASLKHLGIQEKIELSAKKDEEFKAKLLEIFEAMEKRVNDTQIMVIQIHKAIVK